jgi:hypothetical protein
VASYLAPVSQYDFANRYGAFLGFLQRRGRLDLSAAAAAQVTSANVDAYITELRSRVRSVTVYNCVYKFRPPDLRRCKWSGVIAKLFAKSMRPTRKAG